MEDGPETVGDRLRIAEPRHRHLLDRVNRSWRTGIHRLMTAIADRLDRAVWVSQGGDESSLRLAAAAEGSPAPVFGNDARGSWAMMSPVQPPPEILDRARVLQFASLARSQPTGKTRHVVAGAEVADFVALAIARYDDEPTGVHLFYCDRSWNVVTDTWHENVAAAVAQANFEFGLLSFNEV